MSGANGSNGKGGGWTELTAPAGHVQFVDAKGIRWQVWERDARKDVGARADWCLVFISSDAVRRVWTYPVGWRELSRDALATLSWAR